MNATNRYLDAVRERHGIPSDRQLAKHLGIEPVRISNYRTDHDRGLTEAHALAVANSLGIPFARVMADVRAERTKDPSVRDAWRELAKRLGGPGAAAALVLALLGGVWPSPAQASPGASPVIHYAKSRRWAALMLALFGADTDPDAAGI